MRVWSASAQREVQREVETLVRRVARRQGVEHMLAALCPVWAGATVHVLARHGVRACLQAGTAGWRRLRPEEDDGVVDTHCSYVWELGSVETQVRLARGMLPEMHVWAAIVEDQVLIDFTTGRWLERFKQLTPALTWSAPLPPEFLWCQAEHLPAACYYQPDLEATRIADRFLLAALSQTAALYTLGVGL